MTIAPAMPAGSAPTHMDAFPSILRAQAVHPTHCALREANGGSSIPFPPLAGGAAVSKHAGALFGTLLGMSASTPRVGNRLRRYRSRATGA